MGKAKRRSLNQGIKNKFQYMTRESALQNVVENLDKKMDIIDTITLFGFTAEEMHEAGAEYEDVMALGNLVR